MARAVRPNEEMLIAQRVGKLTGEELLRRMRVNNVRRKRKVLAAVRLAIKNGATGEAAMQHLVPVLKAEFGERGAGIFLSLFGTLSQEKLLEETQRAFRN